MDQPLTSHDIKFVKTKQLNKLLMCHILAVSVHLAQNRRLKGSVMAKTLKKNVGELKNFIKEAGLYLEPFKNIKTNEPDVFICLHGKK